jgi:hypothetical protein
MSIPVVNYTFPLDYADKTNPSVPDITILKSDTGTRKLNITLKNGGTAIDLTDLTPRIYFKKADGNITQGDPTVVDAATGQIAYTLQTNDVAKVGQVICQITLSDASGDRITTFYFDFNVLDTAYSDGAVESTTEFSLLTQYVDNFRSFGEYAAGTTYYINNIVTYEGSSFIALQTTQGNAPPTYPTLYTDYWYLIANGYKDTSSEDDWATETEWEYTTDFGYNNNADPILTLKKSDSIATIAGIGSYAKINGIFGGTSTNVYGIVVYKTNANSYNYISIFCIVNKSTPTAALKLPDSDDTYSAFYFSYPGAMPSGLNTVAYDPAYWTLQWELTTDEQITASATWAEITSANTLRGKIPGIGYYWVKIIANIEAGEASSVNVFTRASLTTSLSGTVTPINKFTTRLGQASEGSGTQTVCGEWVRQAIVSGTSTAQTIYVIGESATGDDIMLAGASAGPCYIQVWPACLPIQGGF